MASFPRPLGTNHRSGAAHPPRPRHLLEDGCDKQAGQVHCGLYQEWHRPSRQYWNNKDADPTERPLPRSRLQDTGDLLLRICCKPIIRFWQSAMVCSQSPRPATRPSFPTQHATWASWQWRTTLSLCSGFPQKIPSSLSTTFATSLWWADVSVERVTTPLSRTTRWRVTSAGPGPRWWWCLVTWRPSYWRIFLQVNTTFWQRWSPAFHQIVRTMPISELALQNQGCTLAERTIRSPLSVSWENMPHFGEELGALSETHGNQPMAP